MFSTSQNVNMFIDDYLMMVSLTYIGLYMLAVIGSVLNALGRAKEGLIITLVKSFLVAVPAAAYLTHLYGYEGFIWSVMLTNIISLVIACVYLQRIRCAL